MHLSRFRPRFTVRWLMIATATIGMLLGIKCLWDRSRAFRAVSRSHLRLVTRAQAKYQETEDRYRSNLGRYYDWDNRKEPRRDYIDQKVAKAKSLWPEVGEYVRKHPTLCFTDDVLAAWGFTVALEQEAYHSSMALKYDHAARYPWLPVAPDPPEPE